MDENTLNEVKLLTWEIVKFPSKRGDGETILQRVIFDMYFRVKNQHDSWLFFTLIWMKYALLQVDFSGRKLPWGNPSESDCRNILRLHPQIGLPRYLRRYGSMVARQNSAGKDLLSAMASSGMLTGSNIFSFDPCLSGLKMISLESASKSFWLIVGIEGMCELGVEMQARCCSLYTLG
jgi:hypothetical protein